MKIVRGYKIFSFFLLVVLVKAREGVDERKTSYASIKDLETFIKTLPAVEDNVNSYIEKQYKNIEELKSYLKNLEEQNITASVNSILNPVSAFGIIKQLSVNWQTVQNALHEISKESQVLSSMQDFKSPTSEDLQGASNAITRLQETYKLKTSDVANGVLNGVNYFTKLSTDDCFELGYQAYTSNNLYHCTLWMLEAYARYDLERDKGIDKNEIIKYIRECGRDEDLLKSLEVGNMTPEEWKDMLENKQQTDQQEEYRALCRGEKLSSIEQNSKLLCKTITHVSPWTKIVPAKVEQVSRDPLIIIFHDVLFDSEIQYFMHSATELKTTNTAINQETNKTEIAKFRIGKGMWLSPTDEVAEKISKRIKHLTGLSVESSEAVHIFNYGMGGHYSPHYDYFLEAQADSWGLKGQRTATMLFYMNDVEQGGATVFPRLRTGVWPKKGSAVFWYNILTNGEPDNRTYHGACPVLVGSKWIATKWFREKGQPIKLPKIL